MKPAGPGRGSDCRATLAESLQAQRTEILQAVLTRVYSLADADTPPDAGYQSGLRATVVAALDYAIAAVERDENRPQPIPTQLFGQAREAARNRVSLDTVLRRYFAGYTLLGDYIHQHAEQLGILEDPGFQRLRRDQAALLDRLLAAVAAEYGREAEALVATPDQRRADLVGRLLAGELLDATELSYRLDAWHVGVVAVGADVAGAARTVAADLDRRPLLVQGGERTHWIWLGGDRRVEPEEMERLVAWPWPEQIRLAVGEPAQGLAGWRLTHRQASAALPLVRQGEVRRVRYGNVATLASLLQDETLATSLRQLYLDPLSTGRDGGAALRDTLRAYFTAQRNSASTAAALGVTRQTVNNRLRLAEDRLGQPLSACATELELALRLDAFQPSNS